MGNIILRGVSSALVVTVITLLAGMFWSTMGYGGLNPSSLVDIGLVLSCATAGYRSGKESGVWFWGGVAALGYVSLSILLAALFLPISGWGAIQILVEGGLIGILAGALGVGKTLGKGPLGAGGNRSFPSRASRWGGERNEWGKWDKWDSPSEREEELQNVDIRESEEVHDSITNHEGQWEEWMSGDLRTAAIEKDSASMMNKDYGVQQDHRMRAEKTMWWEEDVY